MGWPQFPLLPVNTTLKDARDSVDNGYKILEEVRTILDLQRVYTFATRAVINLSTRGVRHYDTATLEAWDSVSDMIVPELREKKVS
jgi:hypothetical protein